MDIFERELVTFVLKWAPFGGPTDDETFPLFGMSAECLKQRFRELVTRAECDLGTAASPDIRALVERATKLLPGRSKEAGDVETRRLARRSGKWSPESLEEAAGTWKLRQAIWVWDATADS